MGLRLTKISPVEFEREAPALNEHLDLYSTIVDNISRSKRFSVREEHLTTLSTLEEAIEDYLAVLEWRMGGPFFLAPYWARYRSIKLRCLAEFKILHAERRLRYPRKLTHHPIMEEVVGPAALSSRT
jgi:hypothetical protein